MPFSDLLPLQRHKPLRAQLASKFYPTEPAWGRLAFGAGLPIVLGFSLIWVYVIFSHSEHHLPASLPNHRPEQEPQLARTVGYFPIWEHCPGKDHRLVTMLKR